MDIVEVLCMLKECKLCEKLFRTYSVERTQCEVCINKEFGLLANDNSRVDVQYCSTSSEVGRE